MSPVSRMGGFLFALVLCSSAAFARGGCQQEEHALLAEFDRLQALLTRETQEQPDGLWHQISDAFLRLPEGAGRTDRLPKGALATLRCDRNELALQLSTPQSDHLPNGVLCTVQLEALARLGRLTKFVQVIRAVMQHCPDAAAVALQREEARLVTLAAGALRSDERPAGRAIFEYLGALKPIQSYRIANLGLCLRQIGDVHAASSAYEQGLRSAPLDLELWNDYGLLLRAVGRKEEARDAFRKSLAIDLKRDKGIRGRGPAITNLMHAQALGGVFQGDDPSTTARLALRQRPDAVLLRRLMLDVTLDRLRDRR